MDNMKDTIGDVVDQAMDGGKDLVKNIKEKGEELVGSISFAPSVQVHNS